MDHEFDLREYAIVIMRRWWLILSLAVIAAVVAGIITWLRPPLYEGKASLAVSKGQFFWGFGSGVGTTLDAKSDLRKEVDSQLRSLDVANLVVQRLGAQLPEDRQDPRKLVSAVRGRSVRTSFSEYDVIVADRDPQIAALLANTYADIIAERMENLYGLGDLKAAADKAVADLAVAENNKAQFQGQTGLELGMGSNLAATSDGSLYGGLSIKKQQLVLKNAALADYRESRERLELVLAYAEKAQAAGKGIDSLPLELLHTPTLTARGNVTREALTSYANNLPGLIAVLRNELQAVSDIEKELQTQATDLQARMAADEVQYERLERERKVKEETVLSLVRKMQEISAKQLVEGPLVTVALRSTVPEEPSGLSPVLVAMTGAVVGALAGVLLALVLEAIRFTLPAGQAASKQPAVG
ncbi:MAG: hypothetical protein IT330_13030 [Anaerolineae bacterium]|nr:hypothetical protein [Anaerolineae bacterium]